MKKTPNNVIPFNRPSVRAVVDEFFAVTEEFSEFGACDTEPRANFGQMLYDIRDHRGNFTFKAIPATAQEWQLFSDMEGVESVAAALAAAAKKVAEAALANPGGLNKVIRDLYGD
jgi:hypothetical protein